ncbi:hypothetical protein [Streptomyces sp. NPDC102437]|uniref:hypothetical protein n=1 Tax=Streptomyces sp. NPDC102437 TaxID=3366175 RepID=UPI00382309C8
MSYLATVAVLLVGYATGRLRLGHRASDWAAWNRCVDKRWAQRRYRWPSSAVMAVELVWQLGAHPIESRRNWRAWHDDPRRVPAPTRDPDWSKNR